MVLPSEVAVPPKKTNISFKKSGLYVIENLSGNYIPRRQICLDVRVAFLEEIIKEHGLGDEFTKRRLEKAKRDRLAEHPYLMNGKREPGIAYLTKLSEKGFKYLLVSKPQKSAHITIINRNNGGHIVEEKSYEAVLAKTMQAFTLANGHFSVSVYGLDKIFESGRTYQS